MNSFSPIPEALADLKKGKPVIVIDSPRRENQGDIIFPAQTITAKDVNFLLERCKGLVCVALAPERAVALELPLMVVRGSNTEKTRVNFAVSVDAKKVTSFGISARDRAATIRVLAAARPRPDDLLRPGHVFPLIAAAGGILEREGHTEATVELMKLAGFRPAGVLCEILNAQGAVASGAELRVFARAHKLRMISVADLRAYVLEHPRPHPAPAPAVTRIARASLPTAHGDFRITAYRSLADNREHVALVHGRIGARPALARIHSQCLTGDTFGSLRCDCREQLWESMRMIREAGSGVIVYLDQEGRGIGLGNKMKAYALQDRGRDTVEANHALGLLADARDYKIASDILKDLRISEIRLLTNNPEKEKQIAREGIRITERIPLETRPHSVNEKYLRTKKSKMGHRLNRV